MSCDEIFGKVNGVLLLEKRICKVLLLEIFRERGLTFNVDFEIL